MKENTVRPFIDEAIFGDQSSLSFCFFYFDCYIEVKPNVNSVVVSFSFSLKSSFFSIVFFFFYFLATGRRNWWRPVETSWLWFRGMCHSIRERLDQRGDGSHSDDDINQESETDRCAAVPKKKCKGGWDLGGK